MKLFYAFPLLLTLAAAVCAESPATQPHTTKAGILIGKETTYIDGPILEDGTIDYITAINALASQGVTTENNAAVPLLKVCGPDNLITKRLPAICKALGVELPAKDAPAFEYFEHYLKRTREEAEKNSDVPPPPARAYDDLMHFESDSRKRIFAAAECPEMAAWIDSQKIPLDTIVEASKRTRYYLPATPDQGRHSVLRASNSPTFTISYCRALQTRASFHLAAGDFAAAHADASAALRLGHLIALTPSDFNVIIGTAAEYNVLQQYCAWAASGKLTVDQLKALAADLDWPLESASEKAIHRTCERFATLDWAMELRRDQAEDLMSVMMVTFLGDSPEPDVRDLRDADPNILLRAANTFCDRFATINDLPTYRRRREAVVADLKNHTNNDVPILPVYEIFDSLLTRSSATAPSTSPASAPATAPKAQTAADYIVRRAGESVEAYSRRIAKLLFDPPIAGTFFSITYDREAFHSLARIALTLALYHADKGQYPDTLAPLAPRYLEKIPDDLYSDAPFIYRRVDKGFTLYSVGGNLTDDGGVARTEKPGADDVVVRVK